MKTNKKKVDLRSYMMIIALLVIWLIFTIMTKGSFLSARNISNLFRQSVFISLLAIGMVMVIILGEIDLSVGSIVGLSGGILAILDVWKGINPVLSMIITLGIGLLLGLWNGYWIAYKGVPSFIVTLGGMLIFRGILMGITKGITIGPMSHFFTFLGKGYLSNSFGILLGIIASIMIIISEFRSWKKKKSYNIDSSSTRFEFVKVALYIILINLFVIIFNSYNGLPFPLLIMIIILLLFAYITQNTVFGRYIYAIGGNSKAAILSGINIKKITLIVFMINGLLASLGGVFLTSRLNAAAVSAGEGAELDTIAACVIGGASLMGGIGTTFGAVVGAIVMTSLDNGMSLLNVEVFWQSIIKGLVLLFAVWFDVISKKREA
ncbi:MAG: sugar ABC transporter permease [Defluviitoga tunisiensis]|jgi:D-xylose transport system permease protein|uniref:Xylose transport system permease protein XylH n=1 Tax=Defluviitoga tunisiensis TaxID=1006576 RepID=A0A0C7NRY1_DEFTU|nr:sugar ABC transporter permease [Defluviitoga tunisiensis]CEP78612.1 Xylose transport system permease protein XylH [Defluviitoga tunisiensis]HOB17001.1 sugar ABC transporter permease [Defluviitoga sp.]HPZ29660.1 sugar ABC transporter permease [Defluviitoga sp.]